MAIAAKDTSGQASTLSTGVLGQPGTPESLLRKTGRQIMTHSFEQIAAWIGGFVLAYFVIKAIRSFAGRLFVAGALFSGISASGADQYFFGKFVNNDSVSHSYQFETRTSAGGSWSVHSTGTLTAGQVYTLINNSANATCPGYGTGFAVNQNVATPYLEVRWTLTTGSPSYTSHVFTGRPAASACSFSVESVDLVAADPCWCLTAAICNLTAINQSYYIGTRLTNGTLAETFVVALAPGGCETNEFGPYPEKQEIEVYQYGWGSKADEESETFTFSASDPAWEECDCGGSGGTTGGPSVVDHTPPKIPIPSGGDTPIDFDTPYTPGGPGAGGGGGGTNGATEVTLQIGLQALASALQAINQGIQEGNRDRIDGFESVTNLLADIEEALDGLTNQNGGMELGWTNILQRISTNGVVLTNLVGTNLLALKDLVGTNLISLTNLVGTNLMALTNLIGTNLWNITNQLAWGHAQMTNNNLTTNQLAGLFGEGLGYGGMVWSNSEVASIIQEVRNDMDEDWYNDGPSGGNQGALVASIGGYTLDFNILSDSGNVATFSPLRSKAQAIMDFIKRWIDWVIAFAVFWICWRSIQESLPHLLDMAARIDMPKMSWDEVAALAGSFFTGGLTMFYIAAKRFAVLMVLPVILGVLATTPTLAWIWLTDLGYRPMAGITFFQDLAANGVDAPGSELTKVALDMASILGGAIPFGTLTIGFVNAFAFRFFSTSILLFTWALLKSLQLVGRGAGLMFICLTLMNSNAAEVRLLNLTTTNLTLTLSNGPSLTIPPGQLAMNMESGIWLGSGGLSAFELQESEYLEVLRFSDYGGGVVLDRGFEPPVLETAIQGFISGLTVFGFAWMVSAVLAGLGIAGVRVRASSIEH